MPIVRAGDRETLGEVDLELLRASRDRVLDKDTVGDFELLRARFDRVLVGERVRVTETVADLDVKASLCKRKKGNTRRRRYVRKRIFAV